MVDRDFLFRVLERFGFSPHWINFLKACIDGPWIFVLVNGSPQGFFQLSRGLWQGDPLPPFVFILLAKVLGRFIRHMRSEDKWKGVHVAAGVDAVTHQQFANYTILFGDASLREARIIKKTLDVFCDASDQQVNWAKSDIFFSNTDLRKQREIARILGVKVGTLPSRFLGTLLFGGPNRMSMLQRLMDSCVNKLEGWKSKWLTSAGRLLLLKSVLSAMPIYSMMCFKVLEKIVRSINQFMRFWNGKSEQDKIPLVAWDKVCQPKLAGGAGLRNWSLLNEAMGAKLIWQMYEKPDKKGVQILKHKYLDSNDRERIFTVRDPPRGSAIWNFLLSCRKVITDHITWQLGNGEKAIFWTDSWDGRPSLSLRGEVGQIRLVTEAHWGYKVRDYLVKVRSNGVDEWKWKDVDMLPLSPQ
ncbi:uncharacterized protein LOC131873582 [Cryptomeria japonica]|uniref:uncharacterized protein LOC131873582 n=1 Tax=Cryptomeria japonica TaxID=3369 RepID=UPI0027DAB3B0|nr:uncharacterized protein LOC131873582 [Cryptomeria japonica]